MKLPAKAVKETELCSGQHRRFAGTVAWPEPFQPVAARRRCPGVA